MMTKYAYSRLCQMTASEIAEIKESLKHEYATLLQEHHQNCAAILFYQNEIWEMQKESK